MNSDKPSKGFRAVIVRFPRNGGFGGYVGTPEMKDDSKYTTAVIGMFDTVSKADRAVRDYIARELSPDSRVLLPADPAERFTGGSTRLVRNDAPILDAYAVPDKIHWVVYCPACKLWHWHGASEGHRVAHCGDGKKFLGPKQGWVEFPVMEHGYNLRYAGKLTTAIRDRYDTNWPARWVSRHARKPPVFKE